MPKETYKIFISADMEGVAGVVTGEQLHPSGFEYEGFREIMTREVNAAVEGAMQAGATEIVVCDAHANAENLRIDLLNKNVQLVRSWPRPQLMMAGLDASFHGAMLLGYHTSTTSMSGVRAHTFSSAHFTDLRLNGQSVPEAVVSALIAGHYEVPVILMSGDDQAIEEAAALLGKLEPAVTKRALGFHAAQSLTPEAACDLIRKASFKAVKRIKEYTPYQLAPPIALDLSFKSYRPAEVLDYLPSVVRTHAHGIRFTGKDILEVVNFLTFVLFYRIDLAP